MSNSTTEEFHQFCKEHEILPAVDKLYAIRRFNAPHTVNVKKVENQMYLYFMEDGEEELIKTNPSELIDNKLVTPYEALSSLKLFFPQQHSIIRLGQIQDYNKLKEAAKVANENLLSYCEFRPNVFFNCESAITHKSEFKSIHEYYKYVFNEYDLLPDLERKAKQGLQILTESEPVRELFQTPKIVDSLMEYGDIFKKLESEEMYIFPGDYFHANEVYPWKTRRYSRHRMFCGKGKIIKYEITKDVLERYSNKGALERVVLPVPNPAYLST
mmetsp:Transcript_6907/g.6059  ORF Transcript_6907/g.6059 Transcript_6907/m.6059 type:complete len:271 (+) Transcript_6907:343-1155(+)